MDDIFGGETIAVPNQEAPAAPAEEKPVVTQPEAADQPEAEDPAEELDQEEEHEEADEKQDPPPVRSITEQLTKGYLDLERAKTQSQQNPIKQSETEQLGDPNEIVLDMLNRDPIGTIQFFIDQAVAPERERNNAAALGRSLESIATQYPKQLSAEGGAQALFDRVSEIAAEVGNPGLVKQPTERILKLAAQELWGAETRQQAYDKAKATVREEMETNRQAKRVAKAPTGAKQKEQPKSQAEEIKENILKAASRTGGIWG